MVRIRRLIIGEAERFPDLAAGYHASGPDAAIAALTDGFADLARRGLLDIDDPGRAAVDFAFLVLGPLLDRALFVVTEPATARAIGRRARAGATTFLRAHRPTG